MFNILRTNLIFHTHSVQELVEVFDATKQHFSEGSEAFEVPWEFVVSLASLMTIVAVPNREVHLQYYLRVHEPP